MSLISNQGHIEVLKNLYPKLHFLCNVRMNPISRSVTIQRTGMIFYRDKHSSILGPLVSYKEDKVYWIQQFSQYSNDHY